jgi:D-hydroxyproline dehydrogenase subunit beta
MAQHYDAAVVGAGIVGLAHAYHLARGGQKVIVFERGSRARGASIRNFGMLWPVGQPAGQRYRTARRSLEVWTEVLRSSGLWHAHTGSLHLAYHDDEAAVLREFADGPGRAEIGGSILSPAEAIERCPNVRSTGLRCGFWSPAETCVDPREVVAGLPAWLQKAYGVHFEFGVAVRSYARPLVGTSAQDWSAEQIFVCTGDDFQTLYPEAFAGSGLTRCKLQMMRTAPQAGSWRLGPMLAAGLTLGHYPAFADCPTLPVVASRFRAELPEYGRYGIHVLVSQNGLGELVLGDSHEYGDPVEPFDKQEIDDLVLRYLATFLRPPELRIAARWHGVYGKHPRQPWFIARPADGVTVVTGLGGAGMTLSFGLAERVVKGLEG